MNFKSIIAITILALSAPIASHAADITVTCNSTTCSVSPTETPLFQEENWVPGESITRTMNIRNERKREDCSAVLTLNRMKETQPGFTDMLRTHITTSTKKLYTGSFSDLYKIGKVPLSTIPAGETVQYDWAVIFDLSAGNEYQGAETEFDFNLHVACDPVPTPTLTFSPMALGDETQRDPGFVLTAAIGPEEEKETPKPSVLGLADTGHINYPLWYGLFSLLVIAAAYILDRKRSHAKRSLR